MNQKGILTYYPEGRKVRSLTLLNVTGQGHDRSSFLKGAANFAYQYRVMAETLVTENNGLRIVFIQSFPEVTQLKARSTESLELSPPTDPVLKVVWPLVEKRVLDNAPVYRIIRNIADAVSSVDPNLKRTLTWSRDAMKSLGWDLVADRTDVELIEQVESIRGQTFEIEYVDGLGITQIRILKGHKMPERDLERLAHNSSLLLDYYLFPNLDQPVGADWSVEAKETSGLAPFGWDTSVSGTLKVRRDPDQKVGGENMAVLSLEGGDVVIESPSDNRVHSARVRPKPGSWIHVSLKDRIARLANLNWSMETTWTGPGSLLSTVERVRGLTVTSHYEAERVDEVSDENR